MLKSYGLHISELLFYLFKCDVTPEEEKIHSAP